MISTRNDSWDINEATVFAAESIEPYIAEMRDRMIDPPQDTDHYLCGAKHPKLRSEQDVDGNTH